MTEITDAAGKHDTSGGLPRHSVAEALGQLVGAQRAIAGFQAGMADTHWVGVTPRMFGVGMTSKAPGFGISPKTLGYESVAGSTVTFSKLAQQLADQQQAVFEPFGKTLMAEISRANRPHDLPGGLAGTALAGALGQLAGSSRVFTGPQVGLADNLRVEISRKTLAFDSVVDSARTVSKMAEQFAGQYQKVFQPLGNALMATSTDQYRNLFGELAGTRVADMNDRLPDTRWVMTGIQADVAEKLRISIGPTTMGFASVAGSMSMISKMAQQFAGQHDTMFKATGKTLTGSHGVAEVIHGLAGLRLADIGRQVVDTRNIVTGIQANWLDGLRFGISPKTLGYESVAGSAVTFSKLAQQLADQQRAVFEPFGKTLMAEISGQYGTLGGLVGPRVLFPFGSEVPAFRTPTWDLQSDRTLDDLAHDLAEGDGDAPCLIPVIEVPPPLIAVALLFPYLLPDALVVCRAAVEEVVRDLAFVARLTGALESRSNLVHGLWLLLPLMWGVIRWSSYRPGQED